MKKKDSDLFLRLLEPNMVLFDIGANIGWYTIHAAQCHHNMKIYAFEPVPKTYDLLRKNIALNKLDNVILNNVAFSDSNHEMVLYLDPLSSASASSKELQDVDTQKIITRALRLDDYFLKSGLESLDLIKCDVEGAELLVFQGGLKTITKYQPIILTEMLRKWSLKFNYHPNDIIKLLSVIGYQCFTVEDSALISFHEMNESTIETNFFLFTHREACKTNTKIKSSYGEFKCHYLRIKN